MARIGAMAAEAAAMAARGVAQGAGNFAVGAAGGFTGTQTPGFSAGGAAGTVVGQAARHRVQDIQSGANRATQRQVFATQQFARTGQATPPAQQLSPSQNAAVQAQIAARMHAQQSAAAAAGPRGGR